MVQMVNSSANGNPAPNCASPSTGGKSSKATLDSLTKSGQITLTTYDTSNLEIGGTTMCYNFHIQENIKKTMF